jgi:alkaline phosphatase D
VRALAAEVPVVAQWDDHETHNNWWPGQQLDDDRYKDRDASRLAALARRAMFEWTPLPTGPMHRVIHYGPLLDVIVLDARSYRTPNDEGVATTMLGAEQARWLVKQLAGSKARWRLVACDQPIGLVIGDGPDAKRREGFADGVDGPPGGREVELAAVLSELKTRGIRETAWITADVHYPAAHQFDPGRANGVDFDPFWEFIAGPIHAGTFGPEPLDPTLGPEVKFQWVPPKGTGNLAPSDGLQSYGTIDVSPEALSVKLWGILEDKPRFELELT